MEFVMVTVGAQTAGSGLPNFVCLDDEETALAFKIIANEEANLFVMGHPSRTDFKIWQLKVIKNINDEAIFVGGENFREFCDAKNLFYRSSLNEKGQLLSCSDCVYLKKDGEDCRKPLSMEDIKNGLHQ